jgi:hypothetical protein
MADAREAHKITRTPAWFRPIEKYSAVLQRLALNYENVIACKVADIAQI